jgi:hypothetical protein
MQYITKIATSQSQKPRFPLPQTSVQVDRSFLWFFCDESRSDHDPHPQKLIGIKKIYQSENYMSRVSCDLYRYGGTCLIIFNFDVNKWKKSVSLLKKKCIKNKNLRYCHFLIQGPEAVRATNVFYYLTYEGAVDLESTQEIQPSFTEPKATFAKVKPKTTFEKFDLTDDEVGKSYSIFGRFSGPESTFCKFSGRGRIFSEQP